MQARQARIPDLARRLTLVGGLIMVAALMTACGSGSSGAAERLKVQGRTVFLSNPARAGNEPAPLIIALHGGLGNARNFRSALQLEGNKTLSRARIAYLQGTPITRVTPRRRVWNAGACCGRAARDGVNDVAFIAAVINTLQQRGLAAPGRVTLVGHSNGAMMAYRFACERGDMVRRVVAISASVTSERCAGARGVRILHLHGASDGNVPVAGGRGGGPSGVKYRSVDSSAAKLRRAGADVEVQVLRGAGHRLSDIDAALRAQGRGGIARVLANFSAR